jgi:hypothetical protein
VRARRFAAIGLLGRGAITREEALDACGVVRGFLEALTRASATIGAVAREGAKEVAELAAQFDRLRPPPALTRGARWGRSRPARAGR